MRTAELIAKEAMRLPEGMAVEVLEYIHRLRSREGCVRHRIDTAAALELLDHPPLELGGRYLSRDQCHERP